MKLVTYEAGGRPRVGVLRGEQVVDAGFDDDMVAFIEAGAPVADSGEAVDGACLLAPLRPRTLRDFLAFEGHLKNAYGALGRDIPPEWYEIPAYYKGMPTPSSGRTRRCRGRRREGAVGMGPGKAKDWDGSNVLGPCIVTADEFDPSDMIAYSSRAQTLRAGEVIGSGTAAGGSGLELGRRLSEGDVVELEVEGIGVLRNRIGRKGA